MRDELGAPKDAHGMPQSWVPSAQTCCHAMYAWQPAVIERGASTPKKPAHLLDIQPVTLGRPHRTMHVEPHPRAQPLPMPDMLCADEATSTRLWDCSDYA